MREKVWILKIKCEVGTRGSVTPITVELSEMCEIRGSTTAKELQAENRMYVMCVRWYYYRYSIHSHTKRVLYKIH